MTFNDPLGFRFTLSEDKSFVIVREGSTGAGGMRTPIGRITFASVFPGEEFNVDVTPYEDCEDQ